MEINKKLRGYIRTPLTSSDEPKGQAKVNDNTVLEINFNKQSFTSDYANSPENPSNEVFRGSQVYQVEAVEDKSYAAQSVKDALSSLVHYLMNPYNLIKNIYHARKYGSHSCYNTHQYGSLVDAIAASNKHLVAEIANKNRVIEQQSNLLGAKMPAPVTAEVTEFLWTTDGPAKAACFSKTRKSHPRNDDGLNSYDE